MDMKKALKLEKEKGRLLGIREAARFVKVLHGGDTIADEIIKYVIPHGYKVQSFFNKRWLEKHSQTKGR